MCGTRQLSSTGPVLLHHFFAMDSKDSKQDRFRIQYSLDSGWLAAMAGVFKDKADRLATLNPYDLTQIIPFRKPSRIMTNPILTETEAKSVVESVTKKLHRGVLLHNPPVESWIGAKAKLDEKTKQWTVTLENKVNV
jgi:hypothetical protein